MRNQWKKRNIGTTTSPDVREVRSGGGRIVFLGIPFFLSGLFIVLLSLGYAPVQMEGGPLVFAILLPLGFIFAGTGALLILGRHGLTIDRKSGSAIRWWGLLVPLTRTEYRLIDYDSISLGFVKADRAPAGVYCLSLTASSGSPVPLEVVTVPEYTEAQRVGRDLALFLGKPFNNVSARDRAPVDEEGFGETLRERIIRIGTTIAVPEKPGAMRTRIAESGENLVFEIPAPRQESLMWLPAATSLVFGCLVSYLLVNTLTLPDPAPVRYGIILVVFLVFAVLPWAVSVRKILRRKDQTARITVNGDNLTIEEINKDRTITTVIPVDELEELLHPPRSETVSVMGASKDDTMTPHCSGVMVRERRKTVPLYLRGMRWLLNIYRPPALIARSAEVSISFAAGLTEEELVYLYALIMKRMSR